MRLIDASDVKRRGDCYPPDIRTTIANILSHTKTVKDAVVIVRCKDCKYYEMNSNETYGWCEENECVFAQLDYCSYGSRKGARE